MAQTPIGFDPIWCVRGKAVQRTKTKTKIARNGPKYMAHARKLTQFFYSYQ